MDIGRAIHHAKDGERIARQGWNAPGQFVYYVGAGRYKPTTPPGHFIAGWEDDGLVPYREYLALKTAQGDVVPWSPSMSDALAQDWFVDGSRERFVRDVA